MIDIPVIGKIILDEAYKVGQYFKDRKEEERMRAISDELRRRTHANAGNCLKPVIGSEDDRLYSKMVAKGYLVRVPFGYMLSECVRQGSGSLY